MGRFVGYPVQALEPLQEVRYRPGQYYKPHHDYYNGCETWIRGNRHFTYLVYLNEVQGGGGQTGFPRLNLTIDPTFGAALLFDNVLPNGEPDERTLHEGVAPTSGVKYAIVTPTCAAIAPTTPHAPTPCTAIAPTPMHRNALHPMSPSLPSLDSAFDSLRASRMGGCGAKRSELLSHLTR